MEQQTPTEPHWYCPSCKEPQVHAQRSYFLALALNTSRLLTKAGGAGFKINLKTFVKGMV